MEVSDATKVAEAATALEEPLTPLPDPVVLPLLPLEPVVLPLLPPDPVVLPLLPLEPVVLPLLPLDPVPVGIGCAVAAGSKNRPLATAFEPGAVLMTVILTCPRTVQIRYPPVWKEDIDSVSSTIPVAASVN